MFVRSTEKAVVNDMPKLCDFVFRHTFLVLLGKERIAVIQFGDTLCDLRPG